jgi:hypothetical protein
VDRDIKKGYRGMVQWCAISKKNVQKIIDFQDLDRVLETADKLKMDL